MTPLTICFCLCSVVGFSNLYRLWRDKMVAGVSYWPSCVYAVTNAYEVVYFAGRGDWFTATGAALMCAGTTGWLLLAVWYGRRPRWCGPIEGMA